MRGLLFLLLIGAIVCTVAGAAGLGFGLAEEEPSLIIPGILAMTVPWFGWYMLRQQVRSTGRSGFDAAIRDGFSPDEQQWFSGSGLALDRQAGRLLLADGRNTAVYPLADVETVRFVAERAGAVVPGAGVSVVSLVLTFFAFFSATTSHLESGLYVTTIGRGARKWHIHGVGKTEAAHWMDAITTAAPHVKTESDA